MDEPFGRQPQPVQITVTGREAEDVVYWVAYLNPTSRVGRLMELEKARKCWGSAPAFDVVVLNDVEVRRALS